jgi:hypothetical protein
LQNSKFNWLSVHVEFAMQLEFTGMLEYFGRKWAPLAMIISLVNEKVALSEIFHADMKAVSKEYIEAMKKAYGKYDDENGMNEGEEEEEANSNYGEDNEVEGRMDEFRLNDDEADLNGTAEEVNFDFPGFVSSMAKPTVIDWLVLV